MDSETRGLAESVVTRRNRTRMVVGLTGVLGLGLAAATFTLQALHIRAATGSEFSTYVFNHHIGTKIGRAHV